MGAAKMTDLGPSGDTIVLISSNIGQNFGGEAIKAWQYARYLRSQGYDLRIISHVRCEKELATEFSPDTYRLLSDDRMTLFLWRSKVLRVFMNVYFHWQVSRRIRREQMDPGTHILHYIAPISPVAVRLPPRGYRVVMGPLSGNIYYPPAFRSRMPFKDRLRQRLHGISQFFFGRVFGDKRRAGAILNSGYERTRASLYIAGCRKEQFIDVVDAGVSQQVFAHDRIAHTGENFAFFSIGRLVDVKAFDLAIRAVAAADPRITLSLFGTGDQRNKLEELRASLKLEERVIFEGWLQHDKLPEICTRYRGFVFPSLADSNGIAMQEAMTLGTPVMALRWGGPAMLADDDSAIYIAPESADDIVRELARAMDRLAKDPALAEALSKKARGIAETRFTWDAVAGSWEQAYRKLASTAASV